MNRHSLILRITLFFLFLLNVINLLFYLQYRLESHQYHDDLMKRFHESERMLHMGHRDRLPLKEVEKRVYDITKIEILHAPAKLTGANIILREHHTILYLKNSTAYFLLSDPGRRDTIHLKYADYGFSGMHLIVFALLINLSVLLFYLYVIRRLKPLKVLKRDIVRFAEGDTNAISPTAGKDEIAEVSRAFSRMTQKLQTLQDSRKLFLRNIMHELKTPISKGKLITDLMEDVKNRDRLKRIFSRFEHLLGGFTKIERITSNAMTLNKKKYRVVDIIDNAFDLLLIDEIRDIDIEITANLEVEADYELMSIALKNLIDNAMKHGQGQSKIIVEQDRIVIESLGDELKNLSLDKAFNRTYESSEKGLGLGLYIAQSILSKHGFTLAYEHDKGMNSFIIHF